jgi:hypothetical protein
MLCRSATVISSWQSNISLLLAAAVWLHTHTHARTKNYKHAFLATMFHCTACHQSLACALSPCQPCFTVANRKQSAQQSAGSYNRLHTLCQILHYVSHWLVPDLPINRLHTSHTPQQVLNTKLPTPAANPDTSANCRLRDCPNRVRSATLERDANRQQP